MNNIQSTIVFLVISAVAWVLLDPLKSYGLRAMATLNDVITRLNTAAANGDKEGADILVG